MAEGKYEKYFTRNAVGEKKNQWDGESIAYEEIVPADIQALIPTIDKTRLNLNSVIKPAMFHPQTHKHNFSEWFFFFGSNPRDMHEFDADVEFTLGGECKKHVINSTTIVTLPPGTYHCPLNYARVSKPFYCQEAFPMHGDYTSISLESEPEAAKKAGEKTEDYLTRDAVGEKKNQWDGESMSLEELVPKDMQAVIPSVDKIRLNLNAVIKPGMFHPRTHKHDFTEFFIFFGSNPRDMHEFDAEIEFSLGEECEKYVISSPTIVTLPPGTYHCPLNYARVGKPFYCLEAFPMHGDYTATDL